ncbi:MAG: M28 family peptidase [Clostridia bacterium]|nr:M28 family peptidase [Clostridia bacterium]
MKDYLNEINELHPIRKKDEQKSRFFDYVCQNLGQDRVKKEVLEGKHNNIVIGDIEKAKVLFTAHYDTPATALYPNLMMPRNPVLTMLYHMIFPILMALISLAIAYAICHVASIDDRYAGIIFLPLYFGMFFLATRCFTNKNNKNDNTSGVAVIMSIASQVQSDKVAFILFDNEEKGLLGSKAMAKKYKELLKNKLVINFDCVGDGSEMLFIAKKSALRNECYFALQSVTVEENSINPYYFSIKGSTGSSDYKSFECGVGVMACKKGKGPIKFYTSRIHTAKDVVAKTENVEYLTNKMLEFIEEIETLY